VVVDADGPATKLAPSTVNRILSVTWNQAGETRSVI
jgi:hypothetical protein